MGIAVGIVFWVQWSTARQNTAELVTERANLFADQITKDINGQLQPARHQTEFVAGRLERAEIEPENEDQIENTLISSMAAAPQLFSIAFINPELQNIGARRLPGGAVKIVRTDRRGNSTFVQAMKEAEKSNKGSWGEVVFVDGFVLINYRKPIRRDGKFIGLLVSVVSVTEVSKLIKQFSETVGGTGFVLHGRSHVLAHPTLVNPHPNQSPITPLVPIAAINDKALNALAVQLADPENNGTPFAKRFERRVVDLGEGKAVSMVTWIGTYGKTPWGIGAWFDSQDVDVAVRRVLRAGYVGLALFLLSLIAAVVVGRSVARPIKGLTESAVRIGELELGKIDDLPSSWIKELDEQSRAFNRMLNGLRSFETYVPRSLVNQLIRRGGAGSVESQNKILTVMFTDIVGFTSMSEGKPADEIATLVNDHLAILGTCVEDEGGTIDKYIGDALMAFWGAPEDQPDTAARACRAALAMKVGMEADNLERKQNGLSPVRIRIGIHQGPVLVGNIGAPGRVNYTIIGDTVNSCQRLESLGKQFDQGEDATILVSGAIAKEVGNDFSLDLAGDFEVKGREEKIEVHRLQSRLVKT